MDSTFPDNRIYYNLPEGQSRHSGEANDGGHGHHPLISIGGSRFDTLYTSNYGVDPTLLHRQHPSSAVGPSQIQYHNARVAVGDAPHQGPPRAGSSAAEAEGNSITETSSNPYSSHPNLLPLAPSPSRIVRPRVSTRRRSHASGSAVDRADPHHTSHFSSSVSVRGGQHNATSVAEQPRRRRGRHATQRLSPSSIPAPATSASSRFHPYAPPGAPVEAGHGQSSLTSLSTPEPVGLQSMPSLNGHPKLSIQEHASRSELLRNEDWFKDQTEEPLVFAADEFITREYISTADKTRFSAFVWIDPGARRAACRIPHKITVKGNRVPCTYERENVKEAIAHVSEYFRYKGYKCHSTAPGHPCDKKFATRERRNDHQSKANRGPEARIECALCKKSMLERNIERHEMRCKGKIGPESQPER